jgi:beta-lactamase class A
MTNQQKARELWERTKSEKFAVGAFNIDNQETLLAVARAAKAKNSPVLVEVSQGEVDAIGLSNLRDLVDNYKSEFGIDENKVQTAASLNKLPIISYLYSEAGKGKQNLEEQIIIQKDDIQDYGTGSIRYEGEGKSYSLKSLTKLALEQSDNTAAHILGVRLGLDNVQKYSLGLGLVATHIDNNQTSARDMGILLDAIWSGKVTNTPLKLELLDFMRNTDFEDRLARNIKDKAKVYHKAGDGVGFVHDVGIIEGNKKVFILSILASEAGSIEEAKSKIGKIAEFIYSQ